VIGLIPSLTGAIRKQVESILLDLVVQGLFGNLQEILQFCEKSDLPGTGDDEPFSILGPGPKQQPLVAPRLGQR
jgi:hypothetical protein